jgi:hypothetical protein
MGLRRVRSREQMLSVFFTCHPGNNSADLLNALIFKRFEYRERFLLKVASLNLHIFNMRIAPFTKGDL